MGDLGVKGTVPCVGSIENFRVIVNVETVLYFLYKTNSVTGLLRGSFWLILPVVGYVSF